MHGSNPKFRRRALRIWLIRSNPIKSFHVFQPKVIGKTSVILVISKSFSRGWPGSVVWTMAGEMTPQKSTHTHNKKTPFRTILNHFEVNRKPGINDDNGIY